MSFHLPPALKHRRFALLWCGLLISVAGSQMQIYGMFWHVSTLANEPIAVSGIGVARFVPILLFSLLAGVAADRLDRRRVMFATQTLMALVAVLLGSLTRQGQIQLWHIYALTAVQAAAISFDLPARQAMVPNLVSRQDLPNAFSMTSIAFSLGSILGPVLSGVVIASLGQEYVYLINAFSFVAVLAALILMGPLPKGERAPTAHRRSGLADIREGIQFILHQPLILSSMILDFLACFFSMANTLLPFVAKNVLHVGEIAYGWLSAAQSVGAVLISLIFSQLNQVRRQGALLLQAVVIFGLATVIFGLSQNFWLTSAALMVAGAADAVSVIVRNTIRQLNTPDFIRGRMVSINQIFFSGGPQLGEIESGLVGQAFGVPAAIVVGGVGCVLSVWFITSRWPQLRVYDGAEPALGQ